MHASSRISPPFVKLGRFRRRHSNSASISRCWVGKCRRWKKARV